MKRLLLIAALLCAAPAFERVAFAGIVQSQHADAFGGVSKAFDSNNTAGNTIVIAYQSADTAAASCSDSRNTYSAGPSQVWLVSRTQALFYAVNIGAGANTVTCTADSTVDITIIEVSGVAAASFDCAHGAVSADGSGTAADSSTCSTTAASDILIGFVVCNCSSDPAAGSGYSTIVSWSGLFWNYSESKTAGSAGPYGATATLPASAWWGAIVIALKPSGGAAAATCSLASLGAGPC